MIIRFFILLHFLVFLCCLPLHAQLGTCADPQIVTLDANGSAYYTGSTFQYGTNSFFPFQHCSGDPSPEPDYVYTFTAPEDGTMEVWFTELALNPVTGPREVLTIKTNCAVNNDGLIDCMPIYTIRQYYLTAGNTYYLIVQGGETDIGHHDIVINFTPVNNNMDNSDCICTDYVSGNICESFNNYTSGQYISYQSPCWTPWNGINGSSIDGLINNNEGINSTAALEISDEDDVMMYLGSRTSGRYNLSFNIKRKNDGAAHYNLRHEFTANSTHDDDLNGYGVFLLPNNEAYYFYHSEFYEFSYDSEGWISIDNIIDLDNNIITLYVNGNEIANWPFSYSLNGSANNPLVLDAINFWSYNSQNYTYEFFVDDLRLVNLSNLVSCQLSNEELLCRDWLTQKIIDYAGNQFTPPCYSCLVFPAVGDYLSVNKYSNGIIEFSYGYCTTGINEYYDCEGNLLYTCTFGYDSNDQYYSNCNQDFLDGATPEDLWHCYEDELPECSTCPDIDDILCLGWLSQTNLGELGISYNEQEEVIILINYATGGGFWYSFFDCAGQMLHQCASNNINDPSVNCDAYYNGLVQNAIELLGPLEPLPDCPCLTENEILCLDIVQNTIDNYCPSGSDGFYIYSAQYQDETVYQIYFNDDVLIYSLFLDCNGNIIQECPERIVFDPLECEPEDAINYSELSNIETIYRCFDGPLNCSSCVNVADDIQCQTWFQNYLNNNYTCGTGFCGSIYLYTAPNGSCVIDFVGEQQCLITACPSHEVFDLNGNLIAAYGSECGLEELGYIDPQIIWSCGEPVCPNIIDCPTSNQDVLCMNWLQDILQQSYGICNATCLGGSGNIYVATHNYQGGEIIEIYTSCSSNSRYFYNCEGNLVANCESMIGSNDCFNLPIDEDLSNQEIIWDCSQPLPNCNPNSGVTLSLSPQLPTMPPCTGETFCVPFSVNDFTSFTGSVIDMNWNADVLAFQSVGNLNTQVTGLDISDFDLSVVGDGNLILDWESIPCDQSQIGGGVTLNDGAVFFEVCFTSIGSDGQSSSFELAPAPISYVHRAGVGCAILDIGIQSNIIETCGEELTMCPYNIESILCEQWVQEILEGVIGCSYPLPVPCMGVGVDLYHNWSEDIIIFDFRNCESGELRFYSCNGNLLYSCGYGFADNNIDLDYSNCSPFYLSIFQDANLRAACLVADESPCDECGPIEEVLCIDWMTDRLLWELDNCNDFEARVYQNDLDVIIEFVFEGGSSSNCTWENHSLYSCSGTLLDSIQIPDNPNCIQWGDLSLIEGYELVETWNCTEGVLPNCTDGPWTPQVCVSGNTHFIQVIYSELESEIGGVPLSEGDWLGLFYQKDDGSLVCLDQAQFEDPTAENGFQLTACAESTPGADDGFALEEPFQFKIFKDGQEYDAGQISVSFWGVGELIPPVYPEATSRFEGGSLSSVIRTIRDFPDIEDPSCDTPIPLSCGQSLQGNNENGTDIALSYNCFTNVVDGPEVIYTFTTTQDEYVLITLDGLTDDLELLLLDACDRDHCIAKSERTGATPEVIHYEDLPAGDYFIIVDGYIGYESAYTLSLDCGDFPQGSFTCNTETIACGDVINASTVEGCNEVNYYSCSEAYTPGKERIYHISFDEPINVRISLEVEDTDLDLFFLDALDPERCIYFSNESGTELERILIDDNDIIPNRDYYIIVDEYHSNNGGSFKLSVECAPDGPPCPWCPPPVICDDIQEIECNNTITGNTQNGQSRVEKWGDCSSYNIGPELIYHFYNPEIQDVQFVLGDFTENLNFYVLRGDCSIHACDPDWQGNKSGLIEESILITAMPEGDYYLVVDSYDASSNFTLEVKCNETINDCFEVLAVQDFSYISSNVTPNDPDITNILNPNDYAGVNILLSDDQMRTYNPHFTSPNDPNAIKVWDVASGYRVDVSEPITITFCGEDADTFQIKNVSIDVLNNYIAYPFQSEMLVKDVFADSPSDNLLSVIYWPPNSGPSQNYNLAFDIGENFNMIPGNGYVLRVSQDGEFSYRNNEEAFSPNGCTYFRTPIRNTMQRAFVMAELNLLNDLLSPGDELGFFNEDGLICGSGKYNGFNLIITLQGDNLQTENHEGYVENEPMILKWWQQSSGRVQEIEVSFQQHDRLYEHNYIYKVEGLHIASNQLSKNEVLSWNIYPNPTRHQISVEYHIAQTSNAAIQLLDTHGHSLMQFNKLHTGGTHQQIIDMSDLPEGIYFLQLTTAQGIAIKKVVKQ